jgi:mycothiol synthase
VIFVTKDDTPVATAAAWQKERFGPVIGCMHMVGVRPGHQGKNLGYWVSLGAMHQFVAEGKIEAVLETDDFRIPAVKIYLKIGFEPVLIDENQRQRWKTVFNTIQRPDLIQRYQSILDGPMVRLS